MTTHRFQVVVPNPTPARVVAHLRLEGAGATRGVPLDLPEGDLEVERAVICLDPCDDGGEKAIDLDLEAGGSRQVYVVIDATGDKGVARFNLVDEREGAEPGGVMLAVVQGLEPYPGTVVEARNPCPLIIAEAPWWLPAGSEVSDPRPGGPIPVGEWVELIVLVANTTLETLEDATVYLEHLGRSQARFQSTLWNLGSFEPGATFPAVWRIRGERWMTGSAVASVVVESRGTEAIRLMPQLDFGSARHDGDYFVERTG